MMANEIIGNRLDTNSLEYLIYQLLEKTKVSTIRTISTANTTSVGMPLGWGDNWLAHGTLIDVDRTLYLTPNAAFKTCVYAKPDGMPYDLQIIPAIYQLQNNNVCTLIISGKARTLDSTGWVEFEIEPTELAQITPDGIYYMVFLYNMPGLSLLGYTGISVSDSPYIAWSTDNLGVLESAPESIQIGSSSNIRAFGSLSDGSR